jgi:hypothetical protein
LSSGSLKHYFKYVFSKMFKKLKAYYLSETYFLKI